MYSPVRGTVNTPVFGSYTFPLFSHTLSNTITSLPDVLNDILDVNEAVNAGLLLRIVAPVARIEWLV
jgi:hypothetical protein